MVERKRKKYIQFVITYQIVLLIPMTIVSLCAISLFRNQQLRKINDEVRLSFERQARFLSQQLSVIRVFSQNCKYDSKYNELYSNRPSSYLDIFAEFGRQEQVFPFVEAIYLYDKEKKILLSSDGMVSSALFFLKSADPESWISAAWRKMPLRRTRSFCVQTTGRA